MKNNPTPRHFAHLRDRYVTIVAFGDSITECNHTSHGGLNWVGFLSLGLCDHRVFPKGHIVVNAGVGGDSVAKGLKRLKRDVFRFEPDIVIVGFGMNDADHITPAVFKKQLREMVRSIRANTGASILLRTPNPMINMMNGLELTEWMDEKGEVKKKCISKFAAAIREVAESEQTLLVDHYALWIESTRNSCHGDLIRLMSDPTHPNNLGHRRLYHEIAPIFHADRYFYYEWERILVDQAAEKAKKSRKR